MLAALIVTAYILELNMLKSSVKPMISKVDRAIELLENGNAGTAAKRLSELDKMWDKSKNKLSLFIDHCEISEIDILVARLSCSDGTDYGSRITAECRELKGALQAIIENEAPSLINIA